MDKNIKGLLTNQGIYRGDNFIIVATFYFNYKVNDLVLTNQEGILKIERMTPTLLADLTNYYEQTCWRGKQEFDNPNVLGLVFYESTTTESSSGTATCVAGAA